MARGNSVYLLGKILEEPYIKTTMDGEFVVGRFSMLTVRRSGLSAKDRLTGEARSDEILVMSRDSYCIEKRITDLRKGDMVIVKGTLSTRDVTKKVKCSACGEVMSRSLGVIVYVDPITINKLFTTDDMSQEEITKYLIKNAELSNYCYFFGTLVREPRYAPDYGVTNRRECNIQIAVNRKRLIPEDGAEKRTDYPYLRAFGKIAEDASKVLHTGSEIYVEGAIESRETSVEKVCPFCNTTINYPIYALEVVPYTLEYISDIDTSILLTQEENANKVNTDEKTDTSEENEEDIYENLEDDEEIDMYDDDDYGYDDDNEEE